MLQHVVTRKFKCPELAQSYRLILQKITRTSDCNLFQIAEINVFNFTFLSGKGIELFQLLKYPPIAAQCLSNEATFPLHVSQRIHNPPRSIHTTEFYFSILQL